MDTDSMVRVRVEMTVTEEVTYGFPLTVDVPAEVADDVEALTEHFPAARPRSRDVRADRRS